MIIDATDYNGRIFINLITERIKSNQNCMICFVGQTGSGKSYASISLSEVLDTTFNVDRIYFDIQKFIDDLSNNKFAKGQCIIIDDAGVSISNRDWQSVFNKAIGIISQSFRFLNLILIFNVPRIRFIELQVRSLMHFYLINTGKQGAFNVKQSIEIKDLNSELDIDTEPLKIDEDADLNEIQFLMPYDSGLLAEYEKRKADFMHTIYKSLSAELKTGKGNIAIKCEYCGNENLVKATSDSFKCKFCNFRNKVSK